jgi:chromosome segregation protein
MLARRIDRMRLRRVAISGFKTFARRSELQLEPGITAIVGPNGSGKSNLVDAIRWALGETNARELRGARMDEVIYSGGGGRNRMGFAEVELVLDNEDGRLAVEDVEVSVSRRVVRHGDSEFRLNGDRVRLRDIERVLGTTGLTQSGYAVVAQNDIDAIIEASPAQRRALVEQAAGVRSLRAAAEDALGRVAQAETTLRRFEDLLEETEPRLAELSAQAAAAIEQRELTDRLSQLRGSLAREAWRAARAQLRLASRRAEAAGNRLEAAATAEAAFAERLRRHRDRLDAQRSGNLQAASRLEQARLAVERTQGDQHRARDRVTAGVLARAAAAATLRAALADQEARRAELAAAEAEPGGAGDAGGLEARLAELRAAAQQRAAELAEEEAALADADTALRGAEEARLEAESTVRRHATQLRLFSDAAQTLERGVTEAVRAVSAAEAELASVREHQRRAVETESASAAARQLAADALAAARAEVDEAQARLDALRETSRAALARVASLRGQVDGALGGRGAIAEAVAAGDLDARRLIDSVSVIDPADGPAVEAALETHLGAWITDDIDAAAESLDRTSAREELIRREPRPGADAAVAPPGARPAIDAVQAAPGSEAAVVHCLAGVWLVADRAAAHAVVAAVDGRAVLPDGTVVTRATLRGGGRPGRTLELAAQEHEAAAGADAAIAAERAAEADRAAAVQAAAARELADRAAAEDLQERRVDLARSAAALAAAEATLSAQRQRLVAARAELSTREHERGDLHGAEGAAAARLESARLGVEAARAAAATLRDAVARYRVSAGEAADQVREAEAEAVQAAATASARRRTVDALREAVDAAGARAADASLSVLAAELEVLAALAHRRAAVAALAGGQAEIADALAAIAAAAPGLAETEAAVTALEAERAEVAVLLARAQDERTAAEAEVGSAASRVADLADAVRGDEDDSGPEPEAGDAERAEREILRLERRVAAMGPVNALAPEQHRDLEQRVTILRAGRDDLGGACADIRAIAARLTAAIDVRFEAVFGAVSVHFHDLFAELFPGGRATLRREEPASAAPEPEHISGGKGAQCGVEILAQPPGKRLQPLSLLSGGERALTAMAVILALQQVNPSPFYVFDEVDAPLDDSNVLRFTRLLTRLAAEQQFIVVTHNHITMAAADALHGVTSDGDGISSVISVRFDAESGETVPEGNIVGLRQSTIRAAV